MNHIKLKHIKAFDKERYTPAIIKLLRSKPEYKLISQILEIEVKDAPILVLAYEYNAPLATMDIRSLYKKRETIKKLTGVDIIKPSDLLELIRKSQ